MSYKFNPLTGLLDLVTEAQENFSYAFIPVTDSKLIAAGQEMALTVQLDIEGSLVVDGVLDFVLEADPFFENYDFIPPEQVSKIRNNKFSLFSGPLDVEGALIIEGKLIEV